MSVTTASVNAPTASWISGVRRHPNEKRGGGINYDTPALFISFWRREYGLPTATYGSGCVGNEKLAVLFGTSLVADDEQWSQSKFKSW